jgi:hypothetical protein
MQRVCGGQARREAEWRWAVVIGQNNGKYLVILLTGSRRGIYDHFHVSKISEKCVELEFKYLRHMYRI